MFIIKRDNLEKKKKRCCESDVLSSSVGAGAYRHCLIANVQCEVEEERRDVMELLMCEKDQVLQSNQIPGSREHMAPS